MRHRVLKWPVCFFVYFVIVGVELSYLRSTVLITSLFCTRKMADACLVCLYKQETSSRGMTFTCVRTVLLLTKIVVECMFYGVNSSGKETGKDRETVMR